MLLFFGMNAGGHLGLYLAEFEFRYNKRSALGCNDRDRSFAALSCIIGKHITYKSTGEQKARRA